MPELPVPGEVFAVYQPVIGHLAALIWLNLRFAAHTGSPLPLEAPAEAGIDADTAEVQAALERLIAYDLIEYDAEREEWLVHDPLTQGEFERRFGERKEEEKDQALAGVGGLRALPGGAPPASSGHSSGPPASREEGAERDAGARGRDKPRKDPAPQPSLPLAQDSQAEPPKAGTVMRSPLSRRRRMGGTLKLVEAGRDPLPAENPDMQAVVQIYHKRIGMMGPTQFERLRFWVEEKQMEGAVVALAIEETVRSADVPRISYLEGILRNWYNDGIRTISDVQDRKRASKVLADGRGAGNEHEGMPNASAYQSVSPDLVAKWKEMYPDEYDD